MAETIKVEYTIEPSWTHEHYTDAIEIDAAELDGLSESDREVAILLAVEEQVNSVCPWGFREVSCDGPVQACADK